MLILTRNIGESVIINQEVEVKVLGVDRNQIRLGFVADKNIPIHRKEIQEKIDAENNLPH